MTGFSWTLPPAGSSSQLLAWGPGSVAPAWWRPPAAPATGSPVSPLGPATQPWGLAAACPRGPQGCLGLGVPGRPPPPALSPCFQRGFGSHSVRLRPRLCRGLACVSTAGEGSTEGSFLDLRFGHLRAACSFLSGLLLAVRKWGSCLVQGSLGPWALGAEPRVPWSRPLAGTGSLQQGPHLT